jgi:hypothetical protein
MNPHAFADAGYSARTYLSKDYADASMTALKDLTISPDISRFASLNLNLENVRPTTQITFSGERQTRPTVDKLLAAKSSEIDIC